MTLVGDRVFETTTTTGTGTIALLGAPSGFQAFRDVFDTNDKIFYLISQNDGVDGWEVGIGTLTEGPPDNLSRDTVLSSSAAGGKVNFGAGTKNVLVGLAASEVNQLINNSPRLDLANVFTNNQTIQLDNDGVLRGPVVRLYRNSASPAAGDELGAIPFDGKDSLGNQTKYAGIRVEVVDPTNDAEAGELILESTSGGVDADRVGIGEGIYAKGATGGDQGPRTANFSELYEDGKRHRLLQDVLETPQATTSGTFKDYTNIRADARRITVFFMRVSTNGISPFLVQIGAGAIATAGYHSTADIGGTELVSEAGFIVNINGVAASTWSGKVVIELADPTTNTWVANGRIQRDGILVAGEMSSGIKDLPGTNDRVRITTVNGTDEFDLGKVNILVE